MRRDTYLKNTLKETITYEKENDKKISCTILAILYVLLAYTSPFIWLEVAGEDSPSIIFLVLAIPFLFGIMIAIYLRINFQKIERSTLLRCSIIIKYSLIPMYIVGGALISIFFLLTFTPIVIMIFIGPFMIAMLSVYGYITMLGGNAFSLAYIRKAQKEGVHGLFFSTIGRICQFFFSVDVISLAILSLKEKKYIVATVTVIILLLLGFIGVTAWLVVSIVNA